MASIKSQILLNDGMSGVLRKMNSALLTCIDSFESMQRASGNTVDVANLQQARSSLISVSHTIEEINSGQRGVNESMEQGVSTAGDLAKKIAGIAATYLSLKTAVGFVKEAFAEASEGFNIDAQLAVSFKNSGLDKQAFDQLKGAAGQYKMYAETAMSSAAAEFATYISDADAIESMMGTLADYAAGMSGGAELNTQQLTEYATQLAKVLNGQFDGIAKKGFEASEAQKKILETGTEAEKVAVVGDIISESWAGMYDVMSQTPQGQILAMNNAISQIKENVGGALTPILMSLVMLVMNNLPLIETIINSIGSGIGAIIPIVGGLLNIAMLIASFIIDNWGWIEPIIWGIVGAFVAWKIVTIALAVQNAILNGVLLANPIYLIIAAVVAVIAVIYRWIQAVGGLQNAWAICKASLMIAWNALKVAFIWTVNLMMDLINKLQYAWVSAGHAIANFMGDIKVAVLTVLQNMINAAIDIINDFITALNYIPGVNIDLIGQVTFATTAAAEHEAAKQARADDLAKYKSELDADKAERDANLKNAQTELSDSVEELKALYKASTESAKSEPEETANANENAINSILASGGGSGLGGGIDKDVKDISGNTGSIAKSMNASAEDLKYMKDIAEREAINKFTTAEVKVEMTNNNNISKEADADMLIAYLAEQVQEASEMIAEGV